MKDPEEALAAARRPPPLGIPYAGARMRSGSDPSRRGRLEIRSVSARRLAEWAIIEPERGARSTPPAALGRPITAVKLLLVRLLRQYLGQMSAQQSRFNAHVAAHVMRLEERVAELEDAARREREGPRRRRAAVCMRVDAGPLRGRPGRCGDQSGAGLPRAVPAAGAGRARTTRRCRLPGCPAARSAPCTSWRRGAAGRWCSHYSGYARGLERVLAASPRSLLVSHNITPAEYFWATDPAEAVRCQLGAGQLAELARRPVTLAGRVWISTRAS